MPSRNTVAVVIAAIAAAAVAGTSFWRSFTAIAALAVAYKVPVAVDGLVVVATVAAAVARHRVARGYSWFLLIAGTIVSVAGNGIHAWQLTFSPIGVGIAVLPPLVTLAAVHLTILLARQGDDTTETGCDTTVDPKPNARPQKLVTDSVSVPPPITRPRATPATPLQPAAPPPTATQQAVALDVGTLTDDELRTKAIRLVIDEKMSVRVAGAELGVSKDKVHRWVAAYRATLAATG
ncbi:helix-turn-helix domain-containing protein [Rhodococcus pyridinivorans]|uniref:helix-turn-helix domain-containing protein n=1 Tax=Rhodococcus pyridinivorans TaxID=103816 RepID=UPI003439A005